MCAQACMHCARCVLVVAYLDHHAQMSMMVSYCLTIALTQFDLGFIACNM
jgi:hypothetical protein